MKHLSASLRLLLVVGLLLLVVVCLGAGRPSQAAPGVLVNVKLSGPMAAGGQVAGQPFAISAETSSRAKALMSAPCPNTPTMPRAVFRGK